MGTHRRRMIPARATPDRATKRKSSTGFGDHRRYGMQLGKHLRHDAVAALGRKLEDVKWLRAQTAGHIHLQSLLSAVQPCSHSRLVQSQTDGYFDAAEILDDA